MVLRSTLRANEKTDVKAQTSPSRARTPSAEQREASTPPTQPKGTQRQQGKKAILATTFVPPGSPPSTRRNCRSSASKALASDAGELKKVITSARKSLFNGSHETSVTCASSSLQEEETESNQEKIVSSPQDPSTLDYSNKACDADKVLQNQLLRVTVDFVLPVFDRFVGSKDMMYCFNHTATNGFIFAAEVDKPKLASGATLHTEPNCEMRAPSALLSGTKAMSASSGKTTRASKLLVELNRAVRVRGPKWILKLVRDNATQRMELAKAAETGEFSGGVQAGMVNMFTLPGAFLA